MSALRELTWKMSATGFSEAAKGISTLDNQVSGTATRVKTLDGSLSNTAKNFKQSGKRLAGIGKKMTKGVTLPLAGIGVASFKTVKDFDDGMSQVKSISGATAQEFEALRKQAISLGTETPHSAEEAAEGMQILAAAGKNVTEIQDIIPSMLTLMSAGGVDANTAAKSLTGTMAQFNLQANESGKIIDVFAKGAAVANTNVSEMQEAFKMGGGAMANMNMTIEQATAMTGILANANITGSQAGTTLTAMARDITANADKFKDLNVAVYDNNGNMRDMGSILKDVSTNIQGMTNEQRNAALSNVFAGQSLRGVNAFLAQGAEKYNALESSINGSKGAAQQMAEEMEDNIGGSIRSMKSALQGAAIAIGDVMKGPIANGAEKITTLTKKFSELSPATQGVIVKTAAMVATIGPALSIFGKMKTTVGESIEHFLHFKGAVSQLATGLATKLPTALGMLVSPAGIAIGAITAITIAGVLLYKNWDKVKSKATELAQSITNKWNNLKGSTISAWNGIKNSVCGVLDSIRQKWQSLKNFLKHPIKGSISILQNVTGKGKKAKPDGSHASGLKTVPFDGYIGELHKGEMVLPASTANIYRQLGGDIGSIPTNTTKENTINAPITININGDAKKEDADYITEMIDKRLERLFRNLSLQRAWW